MTKVWEGKAEQGSAHVRFQRQWFLTQGQHSVPGILSRSFGTICLPSLPGSAVTAGHKTSAPKDRAAILDPGHKDGLPCIRRVHTQDFS